MGKSREAFDRHCCVVVLRQVHVLLGTLITVYSPERPLFFPYDYIYQVGYLLLHYLVFLYFFYHASFPEDCQESFPAKLKDTWIFFEWAAQFDVADSTESSLVNNLLHVPPYWDFLNKLSFSMVLLAGRHLPFRLRIPWSGFDGWSTYKNRLLEWK